MHVVWPLSSPGVASGLLLVFLLALSAYVTITVLGGPRTKLLVKQTTRTARAVVDELVSAVEIETLQDRPSPERMELNDLGVVRLRLAEPLAVDPYADNRATGAFILIDDATNDTVGAGMVVDAS